MPQLTDIEAFIKAEGWTDFAIVSADEVKAALARHKGVFEAWVERGYQADMDYLERMKEDRFAPENKLPDIKSVVVLTAWYSSNPDVEQKISSKKNEGVGKVARYAAGKDYHKVLKKRLLALSEWLKERGELDGGQGSGVETYLSVDSGPTVDRVLAAVGGLGFFGKNANIINPSKGSYFFIASLMTNVELPVTGKRRMPNCGDCTRCIDVCPTKAIVGPGMIDARRCIAYLTIENKGGIPLELRPLIGDRIFGCDICQEVCPFNEGRAHRQEVRIPHLHGANGAGESLGLERLLSIRTDEEFKELFAGTPIMRAKRRGMMRNACVVAGNSGIKELVPVLEEFMEREEDEMLREHAQWAIDRLQ